DDVARVEMLEARPAGRRLEVVQEDVAVEGGFSAEKLDRRPDELAVDLDQLRPVDPRRKRHRHLPRLAAAVDLEVDLLLLARLRRQPRDLRERVDRPSIRLADDVPP